MHFGTYMGIYWIIAFIFFPLGFVNPFFSYLFFGLTLGVPFIGFFFAKTFRDKACGGRISFLQTWLFLVFMFMFAALLTAVAHYIYFRFIDNGFVITSLSTIINSFPAEGVAGLENYVAQAKEGLEILSAFTPIETTMQMFSQNFLYCSILSLIIAPFVMRSTLKQP